MSDEDQVDAHVARADAVHQAPAEVMSHGEAAYLAFREVMGNRAPYAKLPKQGRDAWEAAAKVGRDDMRQQYKVPMIMMSSITDMIARFVHDLSTNVHLITVPTCPACGGRHVDQTAVTLPLSTPGGAASFFTCPVQGLPVTLHDNNRADEPEE